MTGLDQMMRYSYLVECAVLRPARFFGVAETLEEARRLRDERIQDIEQELGDPPTARWSADIKDEITNEVLADEHREGGQSER